MALCKDFLRGRCKLGKSCKLPHKITGPTGSTDRVTFGIWKLGENDDYKPETDLIIKSNPFEKKLQVLPQRETTISATRNLFTESVKTGGNVSTIVYELGEKMDEWPLSPPYILPEKQTPAYLNFLDYSMEEARYGFYEAALRYGTVMRVIIDLIHFEKSGQWLLTSYGPFTSSRSLKGLDDYSMEEIRYLFYESIKQRKVKEYKRNLQNVRRQALMKIKSLRYPSPDTVTFLKNMYDPHLFRVSKKRQSSNKTVFGFQGSSKAGKNFGNGESSSIFGNSAQINQNAINSGGLKPPQRTTDTNSNFVKSSANKEEQVKPVAK